VLAAKPLQKKTNNKQSCDWPKEVSTRQSHLRKVKRDGDDAETFFSIFVVEHMVQALGVHLTVDEWDAVYYGVSPPPYYLGTMVASSSCRALVAADAQPTGPTSTSRSSSSASACVGADTGRDGVLRVGRDLQYVQYRSVQLLYSTV